MIPTHPMERIKTRPTKPPLNPNSYEWYGLRFIHPVTLWSFDTQAAEEPEVLALLWQFALSPQLLELCMP